MGLFPKNLDYVKTLDKVLSSGTLGYYDDEAKELVVGGDPDSDLGPATKSTMVHELTHALTDQHFGFGPRMTADVDAERTEQAFALSSLAEGDAELVRELWSAKHLSARERRQVVEDAGGGDVSAFLSAPPYLLSALTFPYIQGLEFVTGLQRVGRLRGRRRRLRPPAGVQRGDPAPRDLRRRPAVVGADAARRGRGGRVRERRQRQRGRVRHDRAAGPVPRRRPGGQGGRRMERRRLRPGPLRVDRSPWSTAGRPTPPPTSTSWAGRCPTGPRRGAGRRPRLGPTGRSPVPEGAGRIIRSGDRIDLVVAADASTADRLALALPAS